MYVDGLNYATVTTGKKKSKFQCALGGQTENLQPCWESNPDSLVVCLTALTLYTSERYEDILKQSAFNRV